MVNKITSSLDTGDLLIGVFLDLKKAFDTVDHKILLDKMHAYGISGNILRWFRSYLINRSQFVSYDDRQSAIQSITCGVPQGSILGPLLFIIYMNYICRRILSNGITQNSSLDPYHNIIHLTFLINSVIFLLQYMYILLLIYIDVFI